MPERMPHERRIVGNYQLLRVLGKGGFAEVYLGKHIHLNTYAAVKLLRTHMDRQAVDKFRREARLVAQLRHPHIISITDFGVTAGVPYLVMDYAPGGTLRQLFPEGTVVDPLTVLSYLSPIAEALDYAHSEHIVHRDVKPENMLIGSADTILLGDFGIAAVIADTLNPTPQTVAGTTAYMAPEQLRGRSQYASDQYALAIVAYEWLCGERPFRGSFAEVAAQHLHADPPSLRKRNPNIPAALEEVIMIALSKQPAQRFPSVGDFVTDFERVLRRPGGRTAPVRTIGVRPTRVNPALVSRASQRTAFMPDAPRPAGISRRTALVAVGVLTVVGAGALYTYTHGLNVVGKGSQNVSSINTGVVSDVDRSPTSVPTGTTFFSYNEHTDIVDTVAWSPDGRYIASGGHDKTVHLVDAVRGNNVHVYSEQTDAIYSVAWSPDTNFIASGGAGMVVKVWDINKNSTLFTYTALTRILTSISWSPLGGRIASAYLDDDEMRIFDSMDAHDVGSYHVKATGIFAIAWSPDGTKIAVACGGGPDASVQVWNVVSNSRAASYDGHTGGVYAIAWSPDGNFIASGGQDKTIHVWNVSTSERSATYESHSDIVTSIAWSPKTTYIASGSNDNTVQVWTADGGFNRFTYKAHLSKVTSVTWSPDGNRIASASFDKTVRVWQAV